MPRLDERTRRNGAALLVAVLWLVLSAGGSAAAEPPPVFTPRPAFDTGIDLLDSAAFSPDGRILATVCACTPPITTFALGGDGTLSPVAEHLFGDFPNPDEVAFSPDGHLLAIPYSAVWMFAVSPAGTLKTIGESAAGGAATSLAFSPDGRLLATTHLSSDTVSTSAVGEGGGLTPIGSFATGHWPDPLAFSPDGHLLAVANYAGSSVSMFTVGSDGTLTAAGTTGVEEGPRSVAFSPDGRLLAVTDEIGTPPGSPPVSMFTVGGDGALTPTPGPTTGYGTGAVAFSPDGHLFAVAELSSVSVFSVGEGGGFTRIGEPLPTDAEWATWIGFDPLGGTLVTTSTNQTSSQIGTISTFSYPIAPPTATIASPGDDRTFAVGETVTTSFSCADSEYGTGIASCTDSDGATDGTGSLDTSKAGTFTYTVTAASRDGHTGATSITYTVAGTAPPTSNPASSPSAPATTPAPRPGRPAVRISGVRMSTPNVTWCRECTYPHTRLAFRLSAAAEVRVVLQRRVHGHLRQVGVTTLHGEKGPNGFPVGPRWHRRLLPRRAMRLLVQLRLNEKWKTEKTLRLTARRPVGKAAASR